MLLLLPLVSFYAWVRVLRAAVPRLRERLLFAAAWWALCLIAITEILSAFHAIRREPIAVAWLATAVFTFAGDFLLSRRREAGTAAIISSRSNNETLQKTDWFLLGCCIVILAVTGITALIAPPNGWDVTLQHMPRVMEWLAQGSIGLFPTNYYVQDFAPPLAEWIMLHSVLLVGSDRFVNLVQWLASAGSALAVSMIAEEFGCAIRGQLIAALLCLTIPQGILSASGAKNDWLVAFWLCVSVLLILRWQRNPRWFTVVTLGIALGALLLTKGTAYAFGPPIAIALLFVTPRAALRKLPVAVLLAGSIMVAINAPHWRQNYRLGHSIFGLPTPDVEGRLKYAADRITPATTAGNIVRETSIHFGTPVDSVNRGTTAAASKIIHALGVDPDDPALIRPGPVYAIPAYSLDEYLAGNPLHLLLIVIAFAMTLFAIRAMPRQAALAIGIVTAFVLYCAMFKWELWAARLHLGLFVLACPIVAAVLYRKYPRPLYIVTLVLLVMAIPPLLFNSIRPLVSSNGIRAMLHRPPDPLAYSILFRSRDEMYFAESVDLEPTYLTAGEAARKISCRHIGLDTTNHPFAYGYILMGIIDRNGPPRRFRYVGVKDRTAAFTSSIDGQAPCLVLCVRCLHDPAKMATYSAELPKIQSFGTLVLFSQPETNSLR
jgi:hypothetical protein